MVWNMHKPTSIMIREDYSGRCIKPFQYRLVSLSIKSSGYLIEKTDGKVGSKVCVPPIYISASSKVPLSAYGENTTKSALVEATALGV